MSAPHAGELIAFAIVITRTCIHGSLACSHGLWTDHAHCANIAHLLHPMCAVATWRRPALLCGKAS